MALSVCGGSTPGGIGEVSVVFEGAALGESGKIRGWRMKKRTGKAKKTGPKKDRAWFERKVAELKTELEKLPADRQAQLRPELEDEGDRKQ